MRAVYKCRLCGERFKKGISVNRDNAVTSLVNMIVGLKGFAPVEVPKTEGHQCGGSYAGSLGLADFQGWRAEKEDIEHEHG